MYSVEGNFGPLCNDSDELFGFGETPAPEPERGVVECRPDLLS